MEPQGKILALDYGKSSIGLAVSDATRQFVFGRGVFNLKKGFKSAAEELKRLCEEEKITILVIGLPLDQEGNETAQTQKIRDFAQKLGQSAPHLPIHFQDESFTSFEADQALAQVGISSKKSKVYQDELAAILILKRYLKLSR